eukprot:EC787925.1.p3 GENE.EC787925.1~~EC787925.1.p3  ORF type:complete len:138 (-),score=51.44 EC787925.1:67-480(-)
MHDLVKYFSFWWFLNALVISEVGMLVLVLFAPQMIARRLQRLMSKNLLGMLILAALCAFTVYVEYEAFTVTYPLPVLTAETHAQSFAELMARHFRAQRNFWIATCSLLVQVILVLVQRILQKHQHILDEIHVLKKGK